MSGISLFRGATIALITLLAFSVLSLGGQETPLKMTILYDNTVHVQGTEADWGFSCLIEGAEKTILFDAGAKSEILFHNIDQLKVDLSQVDQVVITHNHEDHHGGLFSVLKENRDLPVYLPISFPLEFVHSVEKENARVVSVNEPVELCENVYLTGEMGSAIKEHSMVIKTGQGLVVLTGCAHPGIVNVIEQARRMFDERITMALGGFHLGSTPDSQVREIIRRFKEVGVERCGATHCTGEKAIQLFKEAYGENFLPMGTGRVVEIPN